MDVSVIVLEVAVTVLAQADVQGLGRRKLCKGNTPKKIKKTYFG
jgi:hypothetical protein